MDFRPERPAHDVPVRNVSTHENGGVRDTGLASRSKERLALYKAVKGLVK